MAIKLFISYSHKDEIYRNALVTFLSPLKRAGIIEIWHDRVIEAGEKWHKEICSRIEEAKIILLLVSPDFLDSEYIYEVELKYALQKDARKEARVIPVILRPCLWKTTPLATLQALPSKSKAVSLWQNQDEAFLSIAGGIDKIAAAMRRTALKTPKGAGSRKSKPDLHRVRALKLERLKLNEHFSWLATIPDLFSEKGRLKDSTIHSINHYLHSLKNKNSTLDYLDGYQPLPFDKMFSGVRLGYPRSIHLNESNTCKYCSSREPSVLVHMGDKELANVLEFVSSNNSILVVGQPGIGKTTFLKYLINEYLKHPLGWLPVKIDFSELINKKRPLFDCLVEPFIDFGFTDVHAFFQKLLVNKRVLLLLDALDDVPTENERQELGKEIENFISKYQGNKCIITCRNGITITKNLREHFRTVEVIDFDQDQIAQFAQNWFKGKEKTGEAFIFQINQRGFEGFAQLAKNPLLLSLLCKYFEDTGELCHKKIDIYDHAIDTMIYRYMKHRSHPLVGMANQLSKNQRIDLHTRIAYHAFRNSSYIFDHSFLIEEINDYLTFLPKADRMRFRKAGNRSMDGDEMLNSVIVNFGLLMEAGRDSYSFAHSSIHDYLAAKYMVKNLGNDQDRELDELIDFHLLQVQWNDVWMMYASMIPDATSFISKCAIYRQKRVDIHLAYFFSSLYKSSTALTTDVLLGGIKILGINSSLRTMLNLRIIQHLYSYLSTNQEFHHGQIKKDAIAAKTVALTVHADLVEMLAQSSELAKEIDLVEDKLEKAFRNLPSTILCDLTALVIDIIENPASVKASLATVKRSLQSDQVRQADQLLHLYSKVDSHASFKKCVQIFMESYHEIMDLKRRLSLHELTDSEIRFLRQYLYINQLVFRCFHVARVQELHSIDIL